jgi:leader peptidase (prepilin peptidase)/N-methyltransferase
MHVPEWTAIFGLLFGATIGSFLNVVIYRMPRGLSLSQPKNSFCPHCKHQLGVPDLFPLLSWLVLRGRCRYCGAKVPARYFFVELVTGLIWAGIWYQYAVATWDPGRGVAFALASAALVAVIFIDWEFYIIPDQVNAFILFVGLGYNVYLYAVHDPSATINGIPSSLVGAFVGTGVLWLIALIGRAVFGRDAMGHGDIKMTRGIGAVLLPAVALISFGLAIVLGAVLGVVQILARPKPPEGEPDEEEGPEPPPETFASLFWCGLGYFLWIDVWGLFYKPLYLYWFREDPFAPVVNENDEVDDFEVAHTMIPFGPYLALGAIIATVFQAQLLEGVSAYAHWAGFGGAPGHSQRDRSRNDDPPKEHLTANPRLSFVTFPVIQGQKLGSSSGPGQGS